MIRKMIGLGVVASVLVVAAALQAQDTPNSDATADLAANKALVEGLMFALSTGDLDALDTLVTEDYIQHSEGLPSTREGLRATFAGYRESFPDITWTADHIVAEGDYVFAFTTVTGTHEGVYNGIPATGVSASIHTADLWRVEDGLLAEHWDVIDRLGLLQQLGVIPTPSAG